MAVLLALFKHVAVAFQLVNATITLRARHLNTTGTPKLILRRSPVGLIRLAICRLRSWTAHLPKGSCWSTSSSVSSENMHTSRADDPRSDDSSISEQSDLSDHKSADQESTLDLHDSIPHTVDAPSTDTRNRHSAEQVEMVLNDYIAKGTKLGTYLDMDAATATRNLRAEGLIALNDCLASPFTQPRQLSSHGWESYAEPIEIGGDRLPERRRAVSDLGVSPSIGHNTSLSSIHNKPYTTTSGRSIKPSFGEYSAVHNPRDGLIISYLEAGPRFKLGRQEGIQAPPHVHHWSDVTFLNYKHQAAIQNLPVTRLKHVFRANIESPEVRQVVQMFVDADCPAYLAWHERCTYAFETAQAKALLGTESGWGVLWMILRHPELGKKRIKAVSVYGQIRDVGNRRDFEAEGNRVHLYFELSDG